MAASLTELEKAKKCGDIFSSNLAKAKMQYKELAQAYHPDINKVDGPIIFPKINEFYKQVKEGKWEASNSVIFNPKNNDRFGLKFLSEFDFELGKAYIGSSTVTYVFDKDKEKFYRNALSAIRHFKYSTQNMREEFSKLLPQELNSLQLEDERHVLILKKSSDVYNLKDLLTYFGGSMPDVHVAWVISRLNNLSSYLYWSGLSHNGLTVENCFVSPANHSILLLGGWWYSVPSRAPLIGTTRQIYDIMPLKVKSAKIGSIMTDLESIKAIGTTLLGKTKAPKAFEDWLKKGSYDSAYTEFASWDVALNKSYGARKFIKLEVTNEDIYK